MNDKNVLLETKKLSKYFFHAQGEVRALDDITISAYQARTAALVGESGCGKTTFAKTVMGLYRPDSGTIAYRRRPVDDARSQSFLRSKVRIVFQDPFSSVDPRCSLFTILDEALSVFKKIRRGQAREICGELLKNVELDPELLNRYPHQVSGGQLQRLCIARSLVNDPEMIILDEPTSSLDVTTASRIISLLQKLQDELNIGYLFISHNLKLVRHLAHFIYVMYKGQVVEWGDMDRVYENPAHPYTRLLLQAASYRLKEFPVYEEKREQGCVFLQRCPARQERCRQVIPLKKIGEQHWVRCCNA